MSEQALHPLVDLAAGLLVQGVDAPYAYPEGAQERLQAALLAARGTPELADGVLGLFHAAIALSEEEGSPEAAAVIFGALHAVRGALGLGAAEAEALKSKLDAGLDHATKRAPMVNAKAPAGTFKASTLPPPRRFKP
jgi:predicted DNA-binding transcriptional regulator YafY